MVSLLAVSEDDIRDVAENFGEDVTVADCIEWIEDIFGKVA